MPPHDARKTPLADQRAEAERHLRDVSAEVDLLVGAELMDYPEAMERLRRATAIVFTLNWLAVHEADIKRLLAGERAVRGNTHDQDAEAVD